MDLWLLLLIVILLASLWFLFRKDPRLPPGPFEWPLIGNISVLLGKMDNNTFLVKHANLYGSVATVKIGLQRIVFLNDYSTIHEAFVKSADAFSDRPNFLRTAVANRKVFDEGIIASSGQLNKDLRKFALTTMRDMGVGKLTLEQRIMEELDYVTAFMERQQSEPTNYANLMQNAVSNIICSIIFGQRFDYEDSRFKKILETIQLQFSIKVIGLPDLILPRCITNSNWWLAVDPSLKKLVYAFRTYQTFLKSLVDEHRESFDAENIRDFVDLYLKEEADSMSGDGSAGSEQRTQMVFNENNLLRSIVDLFLAGTETTSTTLQWSFVYMLNYPQVKAKVHAEIDSVIGRDRTPTLRDRADMPYTDAVLHELLRVTNIAVGSVPHKASRDAFVKGFLIPKDSIVIANIHSTHMNEQDWPQATVFRPERWLSADGKFHKPEAFVPFSLGRRVCLGEQLARMELFLFFTTLMQRFDFLPERDAGPPPSLTTLAATITRMPAPFRFRLGRR